MKVTGISDQARKLHSALLQRGVEADIEKWDGHKHIDVSLDDAALYLEIDGDHHYTDSDTILRDLKRDYFSSDEGFGTIHIPNDMIDTHLDKVADALVKVVRVRKSELANNQN